MSPSAVTEMQQLLRVAPPNFTGDPNNGTAVAHAALEALRNSGDENFLFLRTILELIDQAHAHEELLFHCICGFRQVVLQRWSALSEEFRDTARDFLFVIAAGHEAIQEYNLQLPSTIQLAFFTAVASFWKRQWNQSSNRETAVSPPEHALIMMMTSTNHPLPKIVRMNSDQDLLQHLEALMQPQSRHVTSASQFLSILLGEFQGKSIVQYHMPLEFHKKAHSSFEQPHGWLDRSLRLAMGALSQVVSHLLSSESSIPPAINTASTMLPQSYHLKDALAVVHLIINVISWEFGLDAWDVAVPLNGDGSSTKIIISKCPVSWREYLIRPDLCSAIFQVHNVIVLTRTQAQLSHALRQLLLLLASLSGPIFADDEQRKAFATYLLEGTLELVSLSTASYNFEPSEILDTLTIVSRLIANFKLSMFAAMPSFVTMLQTVATAATSCLHANLRECEAMNGAIENMENADWRNEALALILEIGVVLSGDPWLLYSGNTESRKVAQSALSITLGPLYNTFLTCRVKMASLEEYYFASQSADLDEVREEISASDLDDEMTSVAALGRLNLSNSLSCLSALFHPVLQNLGALWEKSSSSFVDPATAAMLEEARLLTLALGHLLTDDNKGETPVIPESIILYCEGNANTTNAIASLVQTIMNLAHTQGGKISVNPHDACISPLLTSTFLWFLNRWALAYILPLDYGSSNGPPSLIASVWGPGENSQQAVLFCTSCCLCYQIHWPQEKHVQESASTLLHQLAKRGSEMRFLLLESPSFHQMAMLHCLTTSLPHTAPEADLAAIMTNLECNVSIQMAQGFQRLSYDVRARILTALLVATGDGDAAGHPSANAVFTQCLSTVENGLKKLMTALIHDKKPASDLRMKDMAALCVALHGAIARSTDVMQPELIAAFMTPALRSLSYLMSIYACDLLICEGLLKVFRDYTEFFIAYLDKEQSTTLFGACADLLQSFAALQCTNRVVNSRPTISQLEAVAEEEQSYSDVLCVIQLLSNLGTKDFLDVSCESGGAVESGQVTEIIFFGLHQVIPLMTKGLLQYPTLCTQYFSLVGFMMDTYPEKVCVLPFELFNSLLESLLFGMCHVDSFISKSSLRGVAAIAREHLDRKTLSAHLVTNPEIFDRCSQRLLEQVIFQNIVWDRIEASGLALLPLAAIDLNRFAGVVNGLAQRLPIQQQERLRILFENLLQADMVSNVCAGGYKGRMNRMKFSKHFEEFVKGIHSFLITT